MLRDAAQWRPDAPRRSVQEVLADPALARYVRGWPRASDAGWVAEAGSGAPDPIGAAWWRYFPAENPGYGFVDASIPEISIGIDARFRGRGLGRRLLDVLIHGARARGVPALSLSVERDNFAVALYESVGFQPVHEDDGALTMLLQLT
jgi:ribosomal protein S18 acetylase RimI-like enzyme